MEPLDYGTANRLAQNADGSITLGDETYTIPQPTRPDFVSLQKFLLKLHREQKTTIIARVSEDTKDLPRDIREMAVKAAVNSMTAPSMDELGNLIIQEPKAMAFWLWTLAKKARPDLGLVEIQKKITDDNINQIAADLLEATSMRDVDPN